MKLILVHLLTVSVYIHSVTESMGHLGLIELLFGIFMVKLLIQMVHFKGETIIKAIIFQFISTFLVISEASSQVCIPPFNCPASAIPIVGRQRDEFGKLFIFHESGILDTFYINIGKVN